MVYSFTPEFPNWGIQGSIQAQPRKPSLCPFKGWGDSGGSNVIAMIAALLGTEGAFLLAPLQHHPSGAPVNLQGPSAAPPPFPSCCKDDEFHSTSHLPCQRPCGEGPQVSAVSNGPHESSIGTALPIRVLLPQFIPDSSSLLFLCCASFRS